METQDNPNPTESMPSDFSTVGREAIYARIKQHILVNPIQPCALIVIGRHGIGKTTILATFPQIFDETLIGAYIDVKQLDLKNERDWLLALNKAITRGLEDEGFGLDRLPVPPESGTLRDWLRDDYLPAALKIIRPHRRLIGLIDNAGQLLEAAKADRLPEDSFAYLQSLLEQHEQFSLVMAANTLYEDSTLAMQPLITPASIQRLGNLSTEESARLLRDHHPDLTDDLIHRIFEQTGGSPRLLQSLSDQLAEIDQPLNANTIQTAALSAYANNQDEFRELWDVLNRDERLVLTAITSLSYDDPLHPVQIDAIERWMAETDFPMDITLIHAAVRGITYHEIIHTQPDGLRFQARLMQKWLLENAQLEGLSTGAASADTGLPRSTRWLIALIGAAVIIILLVLVLQPRSQLSDDPSPIPTVTLDSTRAPD